MKRRDLPRMLRKAPVAIIALALAVAAVIAQGQQGKTVIAVDVGHPGAALAPNMFGVFFEDINFAADGGLYPELIKNRSFEFTDPLAAWREIMSFDAKGLAGPKGELDIRTQDPLNQTNPHYLRVRVYEPGYGFWNSGFRGMGLQSGAEYRFSAYVRSRGPKTLKASLRDSNGKEIGSGTLEGFDDQWKRYETEIRPTATVQKGQLNLFLEQKGDLDLDLVSLFPVDTWNQRPNGLRKDLVQLLYDVPPLFISDSDHR